MMKVLILLSLLSICSLNGAVRIHNPTPSANDGFGISVASVGSNSVLIGSWLGESGASNSGAAHLFDRDGNLVTTFTNPAPVINGRFGWNVAGLGNDRVLIGAPSGQAAWLFATNGSMLKTFSIPPGAGGGFGSIAVVGKDWVSVGGSGTIYLFDTNASLVTTCSVATNSGPDYSLAAVGSEHFIAGAPFASVGEGASQLSVVGAAYLCSTNGTLLTTITNPTPATGDDFGRSVASLGSGRVIVGAPHDKTGDVGVGVAYLFSTNGALLTTLTNPAPSGPNNFGWSVTAVGNDWILVGSPTDGTTGPDAGAAYLFTTNGILLCSFRNSAPTPTEFLGHAVGALDSSHVVATAWGDDTRATNSGSVFIFEVPTPMLDITRDGSNVRIRWTSAETGLLLQQSEVLGPFAAWNSVSEPTITIQTTNTVVQAATMTNRFYRLRRP